MSRMRSAWLPGLCLCPLGRGRHSRGKVAGGRYEIFGVAEEEGSAIMLHFHVQLLSRRRTASAALQFLRELIARFARIDSFFEQSQQQASHRTNLGAALLSQRREEGSSVLRTLGRRPLRNIVRKELSQLRCIAPVRRSGR